VAVTGGQDPVVATGAVGRTLGGHPSRAVRVAIAVGAVVLFAAACWYVTDTITGRVARSRSDYTGLLQDSRDAVYYPVRALLDGVNPYDSRGLGPYFTRYPVGQEFPLYSPLHLLVHLPLGFLSLDAARWAYLALSLALALAVAAVALVLARLPVTVATVFGLGALVVASVPGRWSLYNGQPTFLPVIGVWAALAGREDRPALGVLGVLAALTKPSFGIPLVAVLLARRQWRVAAWGTGIAVAVSAAVSVRLVSASGGLGGFVRALRSAYDVTTTSEQSEVRSIARIDAASAIARTFGLRPSPTGAALLGLLVALAGLVALWRLHARRPDIARTDLSVTLACAVVLVATFHAWYDAILFVLPLLLLLQPPADPSLWPARARTAVFVVVLVSVLNPFDIGPLRTAIGGARRAVSGTRVTGLGLLVTLAVTAWAAWRAGGHPRGGSGVRRPGAPAGVGGSAGAGAG
jgi:hypothetical protein